MERKVAEWMTNTKFESLPLNAIISNEETEAVIPKFKNGKKLSPGKIPNELMNMVLGGPTMAYHNI